MKYELICVDIDGTLLTDDKKMLPSARESLQRAHRMGMQIALISGRMPAGVEAIEKEINVPCIKACNAGTYIVMDGQCISSESLLPGIMIELYKEIAVKNHLPLWIFQERKWYVTDMDQYIEREIEIIRYVPEVVDPERLGEQWNREHTGPNKLLFAADPEMIQKIHQELKEMDLPQIDVACSADTFLEIFPRGMTKGKALEIICEKLGISLKETIAFGDQELDIPMIDAAGVGIAMGNAIEELKARADFVTKSNNEDGIAYALEHYLTE